MYVKFIALDNEVEIKVFLATRTSKIGRNALNIECQAHESKYDFKKTIIFYIFMYF